ncbi:MAG: hypothetical protein GY710_21195 [Desulfobacteraceae bacterium]|nr:hypothetical protein [Desulfobacteraceae bacterium]
MGTKYDLKLYTIEVGEFQAFLSEKLKGHKYGYPCNKALDMIHQAFNHSEQDSVHDNRYYNISIDGVIVAVVAIIYKNDSIHIPYMFVKVPYITDYETVLSKLLSISPKLSDYQFISIDVSALTIDVGEIDFDRLNELGFIKDSDTIYTKNFISSI